MTASSAHHQWLVAALMSALLAAAAGAQAQTPSGPVSLQGDAQSWVQNEHMRDFYQAVVDAFANGPDKVDVAALEVKSREIFQAFARSRGVDPKKMQAHLSLIPRQMVQIAKDDPSVLASYDNFKRALIGPD